MRCGGFANASKGVSNHPAHFSRHGGMTLVTRSALLQDKRLEIKEIRPLQAYQMKTALGRFVSIRRKGPKERWYPNDKCQQRPKVEEAHS
jgi:hypothetical protein